MYNGGISKTRINNSMVPNFVMKVDSTLLNSERVIAVQSLKIRRYIPVCDLVKTDV